MAHQASSSQSGLLKQRRVAGPQEVLIRVSVDAAGQAQSFQVLQGGEEKKVQALEAARLWNFRPCAGGRSCEQVLKFTDYGDSSRVQKVE